jgi:predicted transcriptional regulator
MPIGMFVGHDAKPTCGLASSEKLIGRLDDRASFYEPERSEAQLIWFSQGYLEYRFPNRRYQEAEPRSLLLSMEICSEVAPHHDDWPSDIFLEINGTRIGYWTSPGDFGGQRGLLTPAWWHEHNTQYGMLKTWRVDRTGSSIDGQPLSEVAIGDLRLNQQPYISVRIGVDAHAQHMGGLNIFGRKFGNHAQDIMLQLHY